LKKAAFFDRDGTLIKDVSYLSCISDVELLPGAIDLCLRLQAENYLLFVVTNQSGIGRGLLDHDFVEKTHQYLGRLFADNGVVFTQFYYCPHHPSQNCLCRKPSPGMLAQASREHNLDLTRSLMFGDRESDVRAGVTAGCKSFYITKVLENL